MTTSSAETIEGSLLGFLEPRIGTEVATDMDLFASGMVSSMFAMELVVYLEKSFAITIAGSDLVLDNFRTIQRMTELVLRLRGADSG